MPELPDLLHVQQKLGERLLGRAVTTTHVREPVVLRYAVQGNLSLLQGRTLHRTSRHAHFLVLEFDGFDLAINPMLAGRFRFATSGELEERTLCFSLGFGEELELRYLDEKRMGKAWLVTSGDHGAITGLEKGGVDVLSAAFSRERFVSLLKHRRDQVRVFLMDKRALDSIGNAYADEILFEAGIHPKTWCRSLSHQDALRLHEAVVKVMGEAVAEVARRDQPIDVKVRDFLKVRRKETCPRCSSKLRTAGVKGMDSWFCPRCQPATRELLVDWTKTPR